MKTMLLARPDHKAALGPEEAPRTVSLKKQSEHKLFRSKPTIPRAKTVPEKLQKLSSGEDGPPGVEVRRTPEPDPVQTAGVG